GRESSGHQTSRTGLKTLDDCTRIRVLKVYDACNQGTAIRLFDEVWGRFPFRVHGVQTDNGAEFQSHFHRTASMIKSLTSCSTRTASLMTFTCSTRSCGSGRTTTITTGVRQGDLER